MPFYQRGKLRIYQFDIFDPGLTTQAAFTRSGGTSSGHYASLNVGATVGDDLQNVDQNRRIIFESVQRPYTSLSDSWLVHGTKTLIYEEPRNREIDSPPQKADIILTDNPEVTLFMRYADCTPVLLHDPINKVIGLVHAGWRGTVEKVAQKAVEAMKSRFGSNPAQMLAAVGPSIGPEKYEVGTEVIEAVEAQFSAYTGELLPKYGNSTHFDLWRANQLVLEDSGVKNIEISGICTGSHLDDWFSHRVESGNTGRFGVLFGLNG